MAAPRAAAAAPINAVIAKITIGWVSVVNHTGESVNQGGKYNTYSPPNKPIPAPIKIPFKPSLKVLVASMALAGCSLPKSVSGLAKKHTSLCSTRARSISSLAR